MRWFSSASASFRLANKIASRPASVGADAASGFSKYPDDRLEMAIADQFARSFRRAFAAVALPRCLVAQTSYIAAAALPVLSS